MAGGAVMAGRAPCRSCLASDCTTHVWPEDLQVLKAMLWSGLLKNRLLKLIPFNQPQQASQAV